RRQRAEDSHTLYFREHPKESDREYFEHVFREVGKIPAATDLFAEGKTPLWAVGPTGDACRNLLKFWQEADTDSGQLLRTFDVEDGDTRFLGDLYQELSERAKKKYALLQTPVFVEEFILDRTLTPAINEFGLETVRMIDPTSGSGHFLLGGFERLFKLWSKPEHTSGNAESDAQKALDGVWGVDINPFAVAIARFRLIVAAVQVCKITRLKKAPGWTINLATGDSLLFGKKFSGKAEQKLLTVGDGSDQQSAKEFWAPDVYACEDKEAIGRVLGQQYHAVVGNPPYITVKDKRLNQAYRERYTACHRQYSYVVPFTERFFDLCISNGDGSPGFIGKIAANSFMKREFGTKLVRNFLPSVDLSHVIDTSGAYIPGHGTPTLILFGRNRSPNGSTIRAVLGIKGEPSTPSNPAHGSVWRSIVKHIDQRNAEDDFTSSVDLDRSEFSEHPWSLSGGGASKLQDAIERSGCSTLGEVSVCIGRVAHTGNDPAYVASRNALRRQRIGDAYISVFVEGERVRDFGLLQPTSILFPYGNELEPLAEGEDNEVFKRLWKYRDQLWRRREPNGTHREIGKTWYEYSRFHPERYVGRCIGFAFVATHNHFVLDSGGKVFNRSAPIIQLTEGSSFDDYLGLLGLLNCSAACFWMKQTFHNKGSTVDQHGARQRTDPFEDFYEFTGTGLKRFPIPTSMPVHNSSLMNDLGQQFAESDLESAFENVVPNENVLASALRNSQTLRQEMIALQEELDWDCYHLYGLLDNRLSTVESKPPPITLGQRAFEIVMARKMAVGELETTWFERHNSMPITELPESWPSEYRTLVEKRIAAIESNKSIRLIEQPEFKRRWNDEPWQEQQDRALKGWLLDRLESDHYWPKQSPTLQTAAQLADKASSDKDFGQVAALYRGRSDFDFAELVAELVRDESVPFLPATRYKASGLRKRALWERTWELQRKEDAGEDVGDIPVPPKYSGSDFQKTDYWRLRGKLDVPKERWISFPHCEREGDPSLVVGWAGWDHIQQATAIVAYYDARKREGWTAEKLTPLLAGLDQLLPWIHQWHPEIDPEYNETAGTSFQTLLESEAQELGLTLEDIRNWTPPKKTTKRNRRKKKE
ncbi:MAG TPA: BREX-2 system adenine-specific DNA-methyltransferase PglX, partial [Planctomycetaceae bacterium]|nr:BREX-2 system adenine-specific DNA-methyltransferase PglX [Planctomycetaceae bacterium]